MIQPSTLMPAEWAPQEAVWLGWPHQRGDWPGKFAPVPWVFVEIIRHITPVAKLRLAVRHAADEAAAKDACERAGVDMAQLECITMPTNRGWMRDCGGIFVTSNGTKKMLDWRFNAWAKYPNHRLDDAVPKQMEGFTGVPRIIPMHRGKRVVLEGGSIDVNGKGTLLTTEECLLSDIQCRNPGFTRGDYEAVFQEYLGIQQVIWLDTGIVGDDTHGHVDDISRFVAENRIVTVAEANRRDENHALLAENLKRLKQARNLDGKPFEIIELPMPRPLSFEGQRLPASYANFLIINGRVLVPTFNDPNDRTALNLLAEALPDHEIIGIHAVDLVWGLGTIHCLTQQELG